MVDFLSPEQFVSDADGLVPPKYGGALAAAVHGSVVFGDAGNTVNLWLMPRGTKLVALLVLVTTAFNSSGSDLLDLGITGTLELYQADLDLAAVGSFLVVCDPTIAPVEVDTQLTAVFTQGVADASTGAVEIIPIYSLLAP